LKWIGLTGGIASGKSTVSGLLQEAGLPVLDADSLAHKTMGKGTSGFKSIVCYFGKQILAPNGEIDRKKLGQIVFANPEELKQLEQIIHPEVRTAALAKRRELETQGFSHAFYDVPLLFEKDLADQFDFVVVVYCSEEKQRTRLQQRSGLNETEIGSRIKNQISLDKKRLKADYVIDNSAGMVELKAEVKKFITQLDSLPGPRVAENE